MSQHGPIDPESPGVAADAQPKILDYAPPTPAPPLNRRDSVEYYREPPALAEWGLGMIVFWVIAFIALLMGTPWLLRLLPGPWL
jgi:hypothetical protein